MGRDWSRGMKVAVERAALWASRPRVRRTAIRFTGVGSVATIAVALIMTLDHLGGGDQPTLTAPILGLYRDDGVVVAEVAPCGEDRVRSLAIEQLITNGPDFVAGVQHHT